MTNTPKSNKVRRGGKRKWNGGKAVVRKGPDALSYASLFYEAVNTPRSLMLYILLKHKQYKDLVSVGIRPSDYNDVRLFFLDYQCTKLLAKCTDIDAGIDTRRVAIDSFLNAEVSCILTNDIIRKRWAGEFQFPQRVASVLHRAQRKIADVLGDVPSLESLDFGFGPGANVSVKGDTSIHKKLLAAPECNFALTPVLGDFLSEFPLWFPDGIHDVNIVEGSELTFVPKSAKTMRPICIEPLLNGLYQKGIGRYLKKRLLESGIDLCDQTINQRLARSAETMKLATVDFSCASDNIAYLTVLDLSPTEWVTLLDYGRSTRYTYEGRSYDLHKFSSMGNAYTFELESLIFYALAHATMEEMGIRPVEQKNISVFGDDVIIPSKCYDLFKEAAECIGFHINHDKSFVEGPFRESCGEDVFAGYSVTPFKIESLKEDKDVYKTANQLLKLLERALHCPSNDCSTSNSITNLWNLHGWLISSVSRSTRHVVPADAGDVGFHAPLDVAVNSKSVKRSKSKDGWNFTTKRWRPARVTPEPDSISAALPVWGSRWCERGSVIGRPQLDRVSGPTFKELCEIGTVNCITVPDPPRIDFSYALRSQGRYVVKRSFTFGQWVDPGFPWTDRALRLIA